jgi:hypothetical protein
MYFRDLFFLMYASILITCLLELRIRLDFNCQSDLILVNESLYECELYSSKRFWISSVWLMYYLSVCSEYRMYTKCVDMMDKSSKTEKGNISVSLLSLLPGSSRWLP